MTLRVAVLWPEACGSLRSAILHASPLRGPAPFADRLENELETSGRYRQWDVSIENVFIGEDKSDCAVIATR